MVKPQDADEETKTKVSHLIITIENIPLLMGDINGTPMLDLLMSDPKSKEDVAAFFSNRREQVLKSDLGMLEFARKQNEELKVLTDGELDYTEYLDDLEKLSRQQYNENWDME